VTVVATYAHPFNPGNGVSAERIAPVGGDDDPGDVADNWIGSPCPAGGSPGGPNCATP